MRSSSFDWLIVFSLMVFVIIIEGCAKSQELYSSPENVTTSLVSIDGVVYEMETIAHWTVFDDPVCGAPQIGGIVLSFSHKDGNVQRNVGVALNFDGLILPQMPVNTNEFEFMCPGSNRPMKSSLGFLIVADGVSTQYQSISGVLDLNVGRTGENSAVFSGAVMDAVFLSDSGEEVSVAFDFDVSGRFFDHTNGRRFPYNP